MTKIPPTVGRVVWYQPALNSDIPALPGQPLAATITAVIGDDVVNLTVHGSDGTVHPLTDVPLVYPQPGEIPAPRACYWMPFQLGQAAKAEQAAAAPKEGTWGQVVHEGTLADSEDAAQGSQESSPSDS